MLVNFSFLVFMILLCEAYEIRWAFTFPNLEYIFEHQLIYTKIILNVLDSYNYARVSCLLQILMPKLNDHNNIKCLVSMASPAQVISRAGHGAGATHNF